MSFINLETGQLFENLTIQTEYITEYVNVTSPQPTNFLYSVNWESMFTFFWLPLLTGLLFILFLKFLPDIKRFIKKKRADYGQIEIWMLMPNKRMKEFMIKLDEFSNFKFKGGRYSAEKMSHFVIGYRNNIPVFFYDKNFIMPLIIQKQKINEEIKKQYLKAGMKLKDEEVSAISIKCEPQILELVYSKKLISDLYSIVQDNKMSKVMIWILIILGVIVVLYFTGILEPLLLKMGINITQPVVSNMTINK